MENYFIVKNQLINIKKYFFFILHFFLSMMAGEARPPLPPLTARHCFEGTTPVISRCTLKGTFRSFFSESVCWRR